MAPCGSREHPPSSLAAAQKQPLAWAQRCRLQPFVGLGRRIRRHLPDLTAGLLTGASDARVESATTRLRLVHRLALGFHGAIGMIAMAHLTGGRLFRELPLR